jgi:anti-sigma factor ChrR (cupin superfamily)
VGGAEYFVLEGGFSDEAGDYGQGSWLRLPADSRHRPVTREGCLLYLKVDALKSLRSAKENGEQR